MDYILLFARFILVVILALACITKLADQAGTRQTVTEFGVPQKLAGLIALLIPVIEILLAFALIFHVSAWYGALGSLGLFLVFMAAIGIALAQGRTPDCHCFGQLHSAPIGWSTLAFNGLLAAVAGWLSWRGINGIGPSFTALTSIPLQADEVLKTTALINLTGAMAGLIAITYLLSRGGALQLRIQALEAYISDPNNIPASGDVYGQATVGSAAPRFELPDLSGNSTESLDGLLRLGKPILLILTDPNCSQCTGLLPDLARWQKDYEHAATFVLVSRGSAKANRAKLNSHLIDHVLLQRDREVAQAYECSGTPGGILIGSDGRIGSELAMGAEAIRMLAERIIKRDDADRS